MPTTSFRPTPHDDMHVGHAFNAFINWAMAAVSGGEFVLVIDSLWQKLSNSWIAGYSPETGCERYLEDLEWLGLKPDRVEWSINKPGNDEETRRYNQWRHDRHRWAVEKLGYKWPKRLGAYAYHSLLEFRGSWRGINRNPFGGESQWFGLQQQAGPWFGFSEPAFCPIVTACCVVDDIDFGITAWAAAQDLIAGWGWCLDAYDRLGYTPPAFGYHKVFVRGWDIEKERRQDHQSIKIRQLREAGYEPLSILQTLCELALRSDERFELAILIPEGILEPGQIGVLEFRDRTVEELASGRFQEPPVRKDYMIDDILAYAQTLLRTEVGTIGEW